MSGGGLAGGGLSLTFDNARLSLTASQTDETIPATGESDSVTYLTSTVIGGADNLQISANSGTDYSTIAVLIGVHSAAEFGDQIDTIQSIPAIGNSTGRYRLSMDSTVGTRITIQVVTTIT